MKLRTRMLWQLERLCRRVTLIKWIVLAIFHGGRVVVAIATPVLSMSLMLAFYGGAIYVAVYVACIAARHAGAIP